MDRKAAKIIFSQIYLTSHLSEMGGTFPSMEVQLFFMDNKQLSKPQSHRDLGFTAEEFLEIVDFFKELIRLDERGKQRDHLVQVLLREIF